MSKSLYFVIAAAALCPLSAAHLYGAGPGDQICPHCAGQVGWRDVVRHACKLVPESKPIKKTVYEVKEVPFCLHKLPPMFGCHHGECCDECRECGCVRYKKVLVKKEVVCGEVCTTKCVVEEFTERVPCRQCCPTCPKYLLPVSAPFDAPAPADQELVPIPLPQMRR